jgi:hypothetical protein
MGKFVMQDLDRDMAGEVRTGDGDQSSEDHHRVDVHTFPVSPTSGEFAITSSSFNLQVFGYSVA